MTIINTSFLNYASRSGGRLAEAKEHALVSDLGTFNSVIREFDDLDPRELDSARCGERGAWLLLPNKD